MVLSLHRICPFISSTFATLIRFLSSSLCCGFQIAFVCAFDSCCDVVGLLGLLLQVIAVLVLTSCSCGAA